MTENGKNIVDLHEEIEDLKGTELQREMESLHTSLQILTQNYQLIVHAEETLEESGLELFDQQNREKMDEFQVEYLRRLHNYVSSVYSIIKHSQRVVNKYGEDDFAEHYSDELEDRDLIEKGEFLRQLRHYTQKRKLPPISSKMSWTREEGEMEFDMVIDKEDMLDWDGWNSDAEDYLESLGDEIDLDAQINQYQEEITDFYDWFFRYMENYFHEEFEEREELVEEARELMREQHPDLLEQYDEV